MKQLLYIGTVLALLIEGVPALAAGSNYAEAMRVRRLVIQSPDAAAKPAETITLPVSRGFDQRGTELCWVYATLNALETLQRVGNAQATVELSRRTMQYLTIKDRYLRKIHHTASYIGERGVAVDALKLLGEGGLVAFADFTDVDDPYGSYDFDGAIGAAGDEPAQVAALTRGLDTVYGKLPDSTHLEGTVVTPLALAHTLAGTRRWQSYAVATSGAEGFRPHPDPDARAGAVSYFLPEAKLVEKIHASLKAGFPLELTIGGHCVLIYGAEYDAASKPLTYRIKDSYPGYFYKADPQRIMRILVEVTTVVP